MSYVAIRDWCVQALGGMPTLSSARAWIVLATSTLATTAALAGPVPDYGHDFVVIGDPGNRPVNIEEGGRFFPPYAPEGFRVGQVNYRYRMSRTEVTVGQWLEFVNAYAPYYEGYANATEFTGEWIYYNVTAGEYRAFAGSDNFPTDMGWRYAARYCNWLHNGKSLEQAAFESGAYDTSTFGQDADGNYTDQREHNSGALFWIPTLDEWTKAMHWDPALNSGEGGYWRYPHSSNLEPVAGPPGVGETNAGTSKFYDVGSYPTVQSPWGLLDGSGGQREWLESGEATERYLRGSSWALPPRVDILDRLGISAPVASAGGLRLVSVVPEPSWLCLVGTWFLVHPLRRWRR